MNWLLITVGAIFLISIIVGICKGAIKIAVSLATTIVTLFLVFFATPYVAKAIAKYTPLDDLIKSQVVSTMANVATSRGKRRALREQRKKGSGSGRGHRGHAVSVRHFYRRYCEWQH